MRELKFRVWNNRYNEFVRPDYGLIGFCYPLDGRIAALTTSGEPMEGCIIEQFTGLKDKNDKEIYEGDIVLDYYDGEDTFIVEWDKDAASFILTDTDNIICVNLYDYFPDKELEVIGNIHENPKLMKEYE